MSRLPKAQVQRHARAKARRVAAARASKCGLLAILGRICDGVRIPLVGDPASPWVGTRTPMAHGRVQITVSGPYGLGPEMTWIAPYDGYPYRPWIPKRRRRGRL
jgi:hypothetical protein